MPSEPSRARQVCAHDSAVDRIEHDARSQASSSRVSTPRPSSGHPNLSVWTALNHRDRQKHAAEQSRINELYFNMMARFQLRQNVNTPQPGTRIVKSPRKVGGTDAAAAEDQLTWSRRFRLAVASPLSPTSGANRVRSVLSLASMLVQLILVPLSIVNLLDAGTNAWFVTVRQVSVVVLVVDTILMFNTSFVKTNGRLETLRTRIAKQYAKTWLLFDLLACIPTERLIMGSLRRNLWSRSASLPLVVILHGFLRLPRLVHSVGVFRTAWVSLAVAIKSPSSRLGVVSWVLFSRYSHLLGVVAVIGAVVLLVHYMACAWIALTQMDHGPDTKAFPLLHGQGLDTHTPLENLFASISVLLGALVLAIVYGHIGMLVGNFYSNETAYQRKIEQVFATMEKLGLPAPLRERVNEYYTFMHREYETLDNEVDSFARGLSHTLQLEAVLFKYMELFTEIPFWNHCSTDFQRHLAVHVRLRVYLRDDYIIRRGEVGDEFYMVNKGTCELVTGPDSFEHASGPSHTTERPSLLTSRKKGRSARAIGARGDSTTVITRLRRGQAFGEIALVMNYARTATCRAATPVEIAVVRRDDFQRAMVRYPNDREAVIHMIFGTCLRNNETHNVHCPLKELVRSVIRERNPARASSLTACEAATLISMAANPDLADNSIQFGVSSEFQTRLAAAARVLNPTQASTHVPLPSCGAAASCPEKESTRENHDTSHNSGMEASVAADATGVSGLYMPTNSTHLLG